MASLYEPLVSVIVPAYKQGPLLALALESALTQTYHNTEIVVVNDGSPGAAVRDTVAGFEGKLVYVERENGGVAAARNTGIEASHGELIALLDQDDRWLPDKLNIEVRALRAHPGVALVHSSYYLIDEEGRRTGHVELPGGEWDPLPRLLFDIPISSCTTLFPRRVLDDVGWFDPALAGSDDWDLWLRMAAKGYRFLCISEPLAEYRVHGANTSRDTDLMVRVGLGVLDKFYGLPNLPATSLENRGRALAARHAWAAAVYYGEGRLPEAKAHMKDAACNNPAGVTSGRFLQSLVYSRSDRPERATVRSALGFAWQTAKEIDLPARHTRELRSNAYLVLALHSTGARSRFNNSLKAFAADPRGFGRQALGRSRHYAARVIGSLANRARPDAKINTDHTRICS